MAINRSELPLGWGQDELSKFLALCHNNELATYQSLTDVYGLLAHLDALFYQFNTFSLKRIQSVIEPAGKLLALHSHSNYRGALRLIGAGQCLPTYSVGRAALESALYSWYLSTNDSLSESWHNEPESSNRAALREWSKLFQFSIIVDAVRAIDGGLADRLKYLHQLSIDFGAHPNTDALYSNIDISQTENGDSLIQIIYVHNWGPAFAHGAKFISEVGLACLELFNLSDAEADTEFGMFTQFNAIKERYRNLLPFFDSTIPTQ
jgi:hypothetical protein